MNNHTCICYGHPTDCKRKGYYYNFIPVLQSASIGIAWMGHVWAQKQNPGTFCIATWFSFLMKVSTHEAGEDVLRTAWYSVLPVFQALRCQWLIAPYMVVEIPYLLDKGPSILVGQMQVSKISPSWGFIPRITYKNKVISSSFTIWE